MIFAQACRLFITVYIKNNELCRGSNNDDILSRVDSLDLQYRDCFRNFFFRMTNSFSWMSFKILTLKGRIRLSNGPFRIQCTANVFFMQDLFPFMSSHQPTWACVPSGRVMTGLLGSTWTMETVPSGLEMVCTTPEMYCPTCQAKLNVATY